MVVHSSHSEDAIAWLKEVPRANRHRVALIEHATGRSLTFGEVDAEARRVGARLKSSGLNKGDRVVIVAPNSLELATLYFACLYAGIVAVPLHPTSTPADITHAVCDADVRGVVFDTAAAKLIDVDECHKANRRLLLLDELRGGSEPEGAAALTPFDGADSKDEILVIYTSGTTAKPKGVVHRIADLVGNARTLGEHVGIGPENRFCNNLAMTYLGGYFNLLLVPYVCQASVVLADTVGPTSLSSFWAPIVEHSVNTLWLVPAIMSMLLKMDRSDLGERHCRTHIPWALCGTAPLSEELRKAFEQRYGTKVYQNYGVSEAIILSAHSPRIGNVDGGVGTVLPGVELRIVDGDGREVASGKDGEILLRSPSLMPGYLNGVTHAPELHLVDGFFATGDLGRLEGDQLRITGRKKDLIIRGGVNVSPAAVEGLLASHPDVLECAVVGVPHAVMGEDVVAVIKPCEGVSFDKVQAELADLCSRRLNRIKQPSRFIELHDIPRTTSGKVQKAKIRAWLAQELDADGLSVHPVTAERVAPRTTFLKPSKVVSDIGEALSIKYNTKVYELRAQKKDVIVLSLGEAFFDIPLFPFDDLPFPELYHYSHSRGVPELRKRLADYFRDEYDVTFDPEKEIIVTAGSKIAIYMALLSVLNPNDEVILHDPAWVSYAEQIRLCHGIPVGVPFDRSVFDFEQFVTNRTKMIIVNSPNNPRGKVYSLAELAYLNRLAKKYNLYVLSDEAYSDFLLDSQQFISMANLDVEKSHTIVVNSISKNFGISGWRLGYVISNADLINQILKLNQHLVTCPATILEHYIAKRFTDIIEITKPQMRAVVERRHQVADYMSKIGLTSLPGDSTFYLFVSLGTSKLTSEAFADALLESHGVCVVPGIGYGESCDHFIRVSIGAESLERILTGLDRIRSLIARTSA